MWNTNICLTSKGSIKVILLIACSILLLAFGYSNLPKEEVFIKIEDQPWVPTQEDLDRLYYDDGSWDSIRYVAGGKIDKALTKEKL